MSLKHSRRSANFTILRYHPDKQCAMWLSEHYGTTPSVNVQCGCHNITVPLWQSMCNVAVTNQTKQTNKADCCQFFIAQMTHCNTHVLYMEATQDTHTLRPEIAVNSTSAFNPSQVVPPPGSSRSSGQLLSTRGPSEPSVSVRDGQECSVLFACFFCWGS